MDDQFCTYCGESDPDDLTRIDGEWICSECRQSLEYEQSEEDRTWQDFMEG